MSKHKTEPGAAQTAPQNDAASAPDATAEAVPMQVPHQPLTEQEIQDLKNQAERSKQYYDQWTRTAADLDNYRKRAVREKQDAVKFANEGLLQKLVPVLDNFDMAMTAAASGQNTTAQALLAGVVMIQQQLKAALTEAGLEEIDATQKPFDPNFHEAVAQEESAEVAEGIVVRQLRKGYRLRERLLRPATVVVAKKPGA